jgi:phosphatidylglycerophosphate synthase
MHEERNVSVFDRRPIAARGLAPMRWLAAALARTRVGPNLISVLGVVAAVVAGLSLALVGRGLVQDAVLYIVAAVCIQLRLLANLLDGMVAIEGDMRSPLGDLFNEVPDRVSDTVIFVGAACALGGLAWIGWAAACAALFVTYVRVLGRSLGFPSDFRGPMARQQRMFVMTVACVYLAVAPAAFKPAFAPWDGAPELLVMEWVLVVIALGSLVTAMRRIRTLAANMRRSAA